MKQLLSIIFLLLFPFLNFSQTSGGGTLYSCDGPDNQIIMNGGEECGIILSVVNLEVENSACEGGAGSLNFDLVATDYAGEYPDAPYVWKQNKLNQIEEIGNSNIEKYSLNFELRK